MEQHDLMDILVQAKRMGSLLNEVLDLSRQLAEALDRQDQVVVRMLLSMRREPIVKLELADKALRAKQEELAGPEARSMAALLQGEAQGTEPLELTLAQQAASNRRLYQRVMELDQAVSRKLARGKSIYQQKKP